MCMCVLLGSWLASFGYGLDGPVKPYCSVYLGWKVGTTEA